MKNKNSLFNLELASSTEETTQQYNLGHIYTVSSLTKSIKNLLEDTYPFIWVTGEISNCALPSSGHAYFSLKDKDALINCVMFRNQKSRLVFNLENGMKITGIARLSLYEPRGTYQLIFEHIEASGAGALQNRFEQLKKELELKGFFDPAHKKNLPFLPSKIFVITSPTGAVVQDIINVSQRRFPAAFISVVPVKVQGGGAESEIKGAIELVNRVVKSSALDSKVDLDDMLIIVARGGGSLEDLSAFNTETVARAVFESKLPIISAVGHETDFTICDFVADLRAPTPSAAAELALPEAEAIKESIFDLKNRLKNALKNRTDRFAQDNQLLINSLHRAISSVIEQKKTRVLTAFSQLKALGPMAVLDRGYSITKLCDNNSTNCDNAKILLDSKDVCKGDTVEVILSKGRLICQVVETYS
ncbi:MAG: exodeoxyribonuclease VII large subunit [Desulfamplus sp.]|nr:exodeoxyribonuclease VII large subunit [Desulfamplus sp.]MBF0390419.1 exodeoxyribonuclease VII large subunit [Desulfamplus sp.]